MPPPRSTDAPRPRPYHHGDLRTAALEAALALVKSDGMEALSLRAIAQDLGVTHRALYRHFTDKDGLHAAIAAAGFLQLDAAMRNEGARHRAAVMAGYVGFALENRHLYEAMFGLGSARMMQEPEPGLAVKAAIATAAEAFAGENSVHSLTVRDQVISAWGMAHGLCHLWRSGALRARDAAAARTYILARLSEAGLA